MSDCRIPSGTTASSGGSGREGPRETVCIEANRILDSCRDRDCYENVRVFLTDAGEEVIANTSQVRVKDCRIAWTYIGIDPVQFNRGFFAVTVRFFVKLIMEGCLHGGCSREFDGIAVLEKQVVLFGGESGVSVFRSSSDDTGFCARPEPCYKERSLPTAVVEAVDPIVLGCKVGESCGRGSEAGAGDGCCCCAGDIPASIAACLSGPLADGEEFPHDVDRDGGAAGLRDGGCAAPRVRRGRVLTVSLGVFSLVRVVRPGQYLVNASEFIIPDKECVTGTPGDPCALFRTMAFPIGEFSPQGIPAGVGGFGSGEERSERDAREGRGCRCGCGG